MRRVAQEVFGFASEEDARRVLAVVGKRLAKYGLTLHPDKTRLVRFGAPSRAGDERGHGHRPGTFDFLGFTHHWGANATGSVEHQAANRVGPFGRTGHLSLLDRPSIV